MECSLYALLACFSWSNFYVDGGLAYEDVRVERSEWRTTVNHGGSAIETVTALYSYTENQSPYGRIGLGYQLNFSHVTLELAASHTSSVATNQDRGINAIEIRARWYPFRH